MNQAHTPQHNAASELQNLIADSVEGLFAEQISAELLERFDAGQPSNELWQRVVDQGLPLALVPEQNGGSGASWLDVSPLLRAIGYWQAPLPLAETMLGGLLLAKAGLEVPEGAITLIQIGRHNDLHLSADGLSLDGQAHNVPWARSCRWAVVADSDSHLALVDLQQTSIARQPGSNLAGEERDSLTFKQTRVAAVGALQLTDLSEPVWVLGALLRACTLVGALEACLDKAVNYANERVQFGKAIGKQQALQQYLAQMAGSISAARMATLTALQAATDSEQHAAGSPGCLAFDVAVAKVCASEAASQAAGIVHQVFGAIGFTHEHTLHFATRRLWSWRDEFGSDAHWAGVLGRAAIEARGDGFWAGLTARSL